MEPITRKELFMASAGGQSVELPEPITREEVFLKEIADAVHGGGGGGGDLPDGSVSYEKLDASLKEKVDTIDEMTGEIANKANVDGSYSSLTAGNAEQLVSTVGVEESTPYLFRTTGGSADVGDRVKLSEITGGTIAWNQLYNRTDNLIQNGITFTNSNGRVSISGQASGNAFYTYIISGGVKAGHKYLLAGGNSDSLDNTPKLYAAFTGSSRYNLINGKTATIFSFSSDVEGSITVYAQSGWNADLNPSTFIPQCFDLTQMFGSTIADYIYSLEQATEGAGVAWFRKLFPKDYYAYDAGTLLSVKTTAHKEYGFNAYDNSTGKAKVVGGQVYQITGTYTDLSIDGTSITPDASGYFTPSASGELTVTGGNATDTCIHLKWDGERDGEYEPYEVNTYALDDVELRGIPKLDSSNNLYYDGDSYAPDGTVTRKNAILENQTGAIGDTITLTGLDTSATDIVTSVGHLADVGTLSGTTLTLTRALSGADIVYPLATPTTESADPYQETQVCDDFGTEEFVDSRDVPVPVGSVSFYQNNLRAKLEMAPESPSGNGDYIVRQTDGLNEYVLLEKELPTAPAEDGTYTLKVTVADGTATLSWVADE